MGFESAWAKDHHDESNASLMAGLSNSVGSILKNTRISWVAEKVLKQIRVID